MGGRARPEDMRGSVEPETSEAAVAAVATLDKNGTFTISLTRTKKKGKEYLSRVPNTSILVGERDNGRD
jgi:hypothetical protein